jgi:hypothetical protein
VAPVPITRPQESRQSLQVPGAIARRGLSQASSKRAPMPTPSTRQPDGEDYESGDDSRVSSGSYTDTDFDDSSDNGSRTADSKSASKTALNASSTYANQGASRSRYVEDQGSGDVSEQQTEERKPTASRYQPVDAGPEPSFPPPPIPQPNAGRNIQAPGRAASPSESLASVERGRRKRPMPGGDDADM